MVSHDPVMAHAVVADRINIKKAKAAHHSLKHPTA